MAHIASLFALVSFLAFCQAVPVFVPSGKEITYDYHATVSVGTYKPATYASQFMLHAKLHMQKLDDKHVAMKLTDMTYKLYNGELTDDHKEHLVALPMPEEVKDLTKPFVMVYDEHGLIDKMITDKDDHQFSRNMKKAMGSLMQLDMEHIKMDAKHGYVFTSTENNIYGKVHARYHVTPEHDEMIVDKMLDLNPESKDHSRKWKAYFGTTENVNYQILSERDPLTTGSNRKYTLFKEDNVDCIKEINAQGTTYITYMKGNSDAHAMIVNQDLVWVEAKPIATKMTKPEHEHEEEMKFEVEEKEDAEAFTSLSFGRSKKTMADFEKFVYASLEDGLKHVHMKHLTSEKPCLKQGQWMNRVMRIMGMMDFKTMEHMFVTMEEKTDKIDKEVFDMFQRMLPLVGTKASVLLIRNLIRKQKVSDEMAMNMLTEMPFHLRMPCDKLLTEIEEMIHMDKVNTTIQKTATLAFANMVFKTYTGMTMMHGEAPKMDFVEKYINKYMDLLKNAQDYASQYLYMNALYNIRIGVQKHLEPYVTGKATKNHHLRYLAMCASFHEAMKDGEKVFEIYWPIFADPNEHLELRFGAYITIMSVKPSKNVLMDMYWVMKSDPCPELYHLHWSYLRSIVFSTSRYFKGYKHIVNEMLNYMREPMTHTMSGYYLMDFKDPNYGFGSLMGATILATNTSKSFYVKMTSDIYNMPLMNWALWLKIDGVDPEIISKTKTENEMFDKMHMIEEIVKLVLSMKDQKNLHIEYAIINSDKVIMSDFADHSTLDKLIDDVSSIVDMGDMYMTFDHVTQVVLPNDLGLPTIAEMIMPSTSFSTVDVKNEKKEKGHLIETDLKFASASHGIRALSFYNPIPDIFQGIEHIQVNEMVTAMDFKLSMTEDMKVKLSLEKMDDDSMDKFSMRNYDITVTYVYKDDNNELKKSSKDSQYYARVSRGEDYRQTKTLFEHDCHHTGQLLQVVVFDSEEHISRATIMEFLHDIAQRYYKNYQTMPFGYMFTTLQNYMQYMYLSPGTGNRGILIRAIPSKKYQVNHVGISMSANVEFIKEKDQHLPDTKVNTRMHISTFTKEDKMLHNWDLNAIMDMNPGHTLNHYKINYSGTCPNDKTFKMCIVGMRKWIKTKMIGHMNVTMGYPEDTNTCSDNEGFIEIDMTGELSDEQTNMIKKKMTYKECMPVHMHEPLLEDLKIDYEESTECTLKQTSLRKFEYDIKTTKLSEDMKEVMHKAVDCMKGLVMPFYKSEKSNVAMDEHEMKVIIDYPVSGHEMNMKFITPKTTYKVTELPNTMMKWFGFRPESYHFSSMAAWLHKIGMVESCLIADHHIYNDNYEVIEIGKDGEWMKVVESNPHMSHKHTMAVFVKRIKDSKEMGLRILVDGDKALEIMPEGETYKITWENKPLTLTEGSYLNEDLFSIGMLHDKHHTVIIKFHNFKMYLDYDGEQIRMDKRKMDLDMSGLCFMN